LTKIKLIKLIHGLKVSDKVESYSQREHKNSSPRWCYFYFHVKASLTPWQNPW